MKRMILVLAFVLAFALPVMASNFAGTVTVGVDYLSTGELVDSTEISLDTVINDTTTANITLTVNELLFGTLATSIDGTLNFDLGEGETAEVGASFDLITNDIGVYGQYLGLPIGDDMLVNGKVKVSLPANTYYAVANLVYDVDEDIGLIVEVRLDSDGAEAFSAEAKLSYAVAEDIDITIGYELNDWSDGINDWDAMEIVSDVDLAYVEVVFRF